MLGQMSGPQLRHDYNHQPFPLTLPGGTRLRAVAKLARAAQLPSPARGAVLLVIARPVTSLSGQIHGVFAAELITGAALLLILALSGRWLIGRGLAPLDDMAATAQQITSRGDLAARMPDAGDHAEVGRLGAAINTMLDRIQQAFSARVRSERAVRQFAADASHELLTPLTTIRGYAELYRQGALDGQQLDGAMRRIEGEARRMSTLVAELLELARLDRTSSLDLTETDLAVLVRDAVADAQAVEPGRPVHADAPPSLIAMVDEARIRQVLANLLANVREHTPAGTPAAVRLAPAGAGTVLEVADAGPGMPAADAARAFDRFYRGTPGAAGNGAGGNGARAPHAGAAGLAGDGGGDGRAGSGLGLSIVQAIAAAHGGQAVLESQPGGGTRVQVWLPPLPASAAR
jgi:two-component system OmpR family sensor kinase